MLNLRWIFFFILSVSAYAEIPTFTSERLSLEVRKNLSKVSEFAFLQEKAKELGVKIYLFGGTASAFAHYVRWDLERQADANITELGSKYQAERFDYDFTNIYRSNQDLDIVVDGTAEQAQQLENLLKNEFPYVVGDRSQWEVRLLNERRGNKSPLLNDKDFLNQNTDTNSTGLLDLTSQDFEPVFRDLLNWESEESEFLEDVTTGRIRFIYKPEQHKITQRYIKNQNPFILAAIRYLAKLTQYEVQGTQDDLKTVAAIIEEEDFSSLSPYSKKKVEEFALKTLLNSPDVEMAWDLLDQVGLREKLIEMDGHRINTQGTLSWWMNKEPLRSQPLGNKTGTQGQTAADLFKQLGVDELVVAHETSDLRAYENITRSAKGGANVFISRKGVMGEAAAHGEGFYTAIGRSGARGTRITIRFKLHPQAREGEDFEYKGGYIIVKNKKALKFIPEMLNITLIDFLKLMLFNEFDKNDAGLMEKLKRKFSRRKIDPEIKQEIILFFKEKYPRWNLFYNEERDLNHLNEINDFDQIMQEFQKMIFFNSWHEISLEDIYHMDRRFLGKDVFNREVEKVLSKRVQSFILSTDCKDVSVFGSGQYFKCQGPKSFGVYSIDGDIIFRDCKSFEVNQDYVICDGEVKERIDYITKKDLTSIPSVDQIKEGLYDLSDRDLLRVIETGVRTKEIAEYVLSQKKRSKNLKLLYTAMAQGAGLNEIVNNVLTQKHNYDIEVLRRLMSFYSVETILEKLKENKEALFSGGDLINLGMSPLINFTKNERFDFETRAYSIFELVQILADIKPRSKWYPAKLKNDHMTAKGQAKRLGIFYHEVSFYQGFLMVGVGAMRTLYDLSGKQVSPPCHFISFKKQEMRCETGAQVQVLSKPKVVDLVLSLDQKFKRLINNESEKLIQEKVQSFAQANSCDEIFIFGDMQYLKCVSQKKTSLFSINGGLIFEDCDAIDVGANEVSCKKGSDYFTFTKEIFIDEKLLTVVPSVEEIERGLQDIDINQLLGLIKTGMRTKEVIQYVLTQEKWTDHPELIYEVVLVEEGKYADVLVDEVLSKNTKWMNYESLYQFFRGLPEKSLTTDLIRKVFSAVHLSDEQDRLFIFFGLNLHAVDFEKIFKGDVEKIPYPSFEKMKSFIDFLIFTESPFLKKTHFLRQKYSKIFNSEEFRKVFDYHEKRRLSIDDPWEGYYDYEERRYEYRDYRDRRRGLKSFKYEDMSWEALYREFIVYQQGDWKGPRMKKVIEDEVQKQKDEGSLKKNIFSKLKAKLFKTAEPRVSQAQQAKICKMILEP